MWGGKSDSLRDTDLPGSALVEVSRLITAHEQSFFECKCMAFVGWCTLTVSIVIMVELASGASRQLMAPTRILLPGLSTNASCSNVGSCCRFVSVSAVGRPSVLQNGGGDDDDGSGEEEGASRAT